MKYAVCINPNYLFQRNIEPEGSYMYNALAHCFEGTYEDCVDWLDKYIKRNKEQKKRSLLLSAFTGYFPYGLKFKGCEYTDDGDLVDTVIVLETIDTSGIVTFKECFGAEHDIDRFKPYLRTLKKSNMTEEEQAEYEKLCYRLYTGGMGNFKEMVYCLPFSTMSRDLCDWLNAHFFDYRDLIINGLAIEAKKDMYGQK